MVGPPCAVVERVVVNFVCQMYSIVYVYVVNRSDKDRKHVDYSCLNCNISFKYISRKKVKTYKRNDFSVSEIYRVKGKFNFNNTYSRMFYLTGKCCLI